MTDKFENFTVDTLDIDKPKKKRPPKPIGNISPEKFKKNTVEFKEEEPASVSPSPEASAEQSEESGEEKEERAKYLENRWADARKKLESEMGDTYNVPDKTRKFMDSALEKDAEKKRIEFLLDQFETHKDELKAKDNLPVDKMTREKKISFMIGQGGLKELETNPAFEREREEIDRLHTIQEGLSQNPPSIEAQFLALHYFYNRATEAGNDLRVKKGNPTEYSEIEIHQAERNWSDSSKAVRDLSEQLLGKNVQKEAEAKFAEENGTQREYVKNQFGESETDLRAKFVKSISDKIPAETKLVIQERLSSKDLVDQAHLERDILAFVNAGHSYESLQNLKVFNTSIVDRLLYRWGIYKSEGKPESQHIKFKGKDYPKSQWDKIIQDARAKMETDFKESAARDLAKEWVDKRKTYAAKEQDRIIREIAVPEVNAQDIDDIREKIRNGQPIYEGNSGSIAEIIDAKFDALKDKLFRTWQKEHKAAPKTEQVIVLETDEEEKQAADNLLAFLDESQEIDPSKVAELLEEAGISKSKVKEKAAAWKAKTPTKVQLIKDIFESIFISKKKGRKSKGAKSVI